MEVRGASPQDVSWVRELPAYRVHFWKGNAANEFEVTGCHNVREVIAWADENAGADRSYTLYAVVERQDTRGLVRLFGTDPTRHKGNQRLEWPGQVYLE